MEKLELEIFLLKEIIATDDKLSMFLWEIEDYFSNNRYLEEDSERFLQEIKDVIKRLK